MKKNITIIDPDKGQFVYKPIKYSEYKYRLIYQYKVKLSFMPIFTVNSRYYYLSADGVLVVKPGYQWDGASGPTIDTPSTMRASCVHDVLYQMIRCEEIPLDFKDKADRELQRIMLEDSKKGGKIRDTFDKFRAGYYYWGVKLFGRWSCKPGSQDKV